MPQDDESGSWSLDRAALPTHIWCVIPGRPVRSAAPTAPFAPCKDLSFSNILLSTLVPGAVAQPKSNCPFTRVGWGLLRGIGKLMCNLLFEGRARGRVRNHLQWQQDKQTNTRSVCSSSSIYDVLSAFRPSPSVSEHLCPCPCHDSAPLPAGAFEVPLTNELWADALAELMREPVVETERCAAAANAAL